MPDSLVYCLVQMHFLFYRKILSSHSFASGLLSFTSVMLALFTSLDNHKVLGSGDRTPSQLLLPSKQFNWVHFILFPLFPRGKSLCCKGDTSMVLSSEEAEIPHVIKEVALLIQGKRPFEMTWRSGSTWQVDILVTMIWAGSGSSGLNLDYRIGSWSELLMSPHTVLHTWHYLRSSG